MNPDEGRAELDELLRLSARYWEPAGSLSAGLDRTLERYDLTPELGGVVSGSGFGVGVRQHLLRDERSVLGWSALATYKGYKDLDLFYLRELDRDGRFAWKTDVRYRDLTDERFYGVGLETEAGALRNFQLSEIALRSHLGVGLSDSLGLYFGGDVRQSSARFDEDDSERGVITDVLASDARAFEYGSVAAGLRWDTRDQARYAREGSFVGGEVRQFFGLGTGAASYRKVSLELQNVLPLPGHDHRIATRFRAEWMDHDSGAHLPFFLTEGLGGSHSLRSFSLNRFRGYDLLLATVEYRAAVLPGKLDAVAFWDTGGVYDRLGAFALDDVQHSFGAGVRLLRNGGVLLRLEVAHGAEGPRFLASFSAPF